MERRESGQLTAAARSGRPDGTALGLYLHIPFCAHLCNYCNFNRGLLDEQLKEQYVRALEKEIRRAGHGAAADTIFFGGGTPSLLEPEEVARLIRAAAESFTLAPDAEITLEANPETIDAPRVEGYLRAGVNRFSFGVQSLHDDELARLDRRHSAARVREAVTAARAAGVRNLSLDLMLWLPQQTIERWLATVDGVIALSPEHVSLYFLELYPNAPLREEMARRQWSLAPDDDAADMYLAGLARLEDAEYRQYEISNVARPGREARHNLKYWRDGAWLGFGCGAHSTRGAVRWRNVSATTEYVARVEAGEPVSVERRVRDPIERLEDALFTGLRLTEGIDLDAIGERYGIDAWGRYSEALAPHVRAGRLTADGHRVALTRAGMLVANEIMALFV